MLVATGITRSQKHTQRAVEHIQVAKVDIEERQKVVTECVHNMQAEVPIRWNDFLRMLSFH